MRKIKHAFYIHGSGSQTYITYNRIDGFKTKNPIVALMSFFAEIHKVGLYKNVRIVKEVTKYFKKK